MNKEYLCKITELRHELHRHAELSMNEMEPAGIIKRFLTQNTGFRVVDREGWFYAVKEGRRAGKVAFRADMDALPIAEDAGLPYHSVYNGVSHKCGHDGHCAALCGLAMEVDREADIPTVYLIFQPGEEVGKGAVLCRELIRQENINGIFAFHNLSGYPEKSIVYRSGLTQPSSEGLKLRFRGKTSHASAPEEGCNPAKVIAEIVLHADGTMPGNAERLLLCTVTGIRLGSGDFGISPGEGELCMTLRAEYEEDLKELETDILEYARKQCGAAGIRMEHSLHDYFPETRNHEGSLKQVLQAALDLHLPVIPMEKLWRASEDFGWYLKECPGAIVYIGNGENYPALHTEAYDFPDGILETAVDVFSGLLKRFEK